VSLEEIGIGAHIDDQGILVVYQLGGTFGVKGEFSGSAADQLLNQQYRNEYKTTNQQGVITGKLDKLFHRHH
jgi:hypothetical protein